MYNHPKPISIFYPIVGFTLFLATYALLIPLFKPYFIWDSDVSSISIFALVLLTFVASTYKKLPFKKPISSFLIGLLSYFAVYPLIFLWAFGIEWLLKGYFGIDPIEQDAVQILRSKRDNIAIILFVCLIVPTIEEILFRGYLQQGLKSILPVSVSVVATALVFSLFHYSVNMGWANFTVLSSLFWLACCLGFLVEKTGSLWSSIGLHATFNTVSSLFIIYGKQ